MRRDIASPLILLFGLIAFWAAGQAKINPNPTPATILTKIKQITKGYSFDGGHRTGYIYGSSVFDFKAFQPTNPLINLDLSLELEDQYGRVEVKEAKESGVLKNFVFLSNNPRAYGTKIFSADWATSRNPKYAKVYVFLDDDLEAYKLYMGIEGYSNFEYWTRMEMTANQYQELVNLLTISGKPINVQKERLIQIAKKRAQDSVDKINKEAEEKARLEAAKAKRIKDSIDDYNESDEIYTIVEVSASPKGGMPAFYKYIGSKLKYPDQANRLGVEGKVFVDFVVNKDGTISDVKVNRGIGAGCDEEAVRLIQDSPPWNPAKQGNRIVRQRYTLPIQFKLQ